MPGKKQTKKDVKSDEQDQDDALQQDNDADNTKPTKKSSISNSTKQQEEETEDVSTEPPKKVRKTNDVADLKEEVKKQRRNKSKPVSVFSQHISEGIVPRRQRGGRGRLGRRRRRIQEQRIFG